METTIKGLGFRVIWVVVKKCGLFFGYPTYYNRGPNMDHNFDNHPYETPPHILTLNMYPLYTGSLMVNTS